MALCTFDPSSIYLNSVGDVTLHHDEYKNMTACNYKQYINLCDCYKKNIFDDVTLF